MIMLKDEHVDQIERLLQGMLLRRSLVEEHHRIRQNLQHISQAKRGYTSAIGQEQSGQVEVPKPVPPK